MNLDEITSPRCLDKMSDAELEELADTIRQKIISTVSVNGGHLASNLGIVELTIALHRVFHIPEDKLIFDVGHQCYAHKLLTGRAERFDTLRQTNGISGFPRNEESEYDQYDTGHASTSVSAALGMARARDLKGEDYQVVAVVGDGAMTGGMCYEALNDAGSSATRMIVILNDNGKSISDNVGAVSRYLTKMRVSKGWISLKTTVSKGLKRVPWIGNTLYRIFRHFKNGIRNIFVHDKFFQTLGFRYLGPIDGHDIKGLEKVLKRAKCMKEPVLIHVATKKGSGYDSAENMPERFHGTPPFRVDSGLSEEVNDAASFGKTACTSVTELAQKDSSICVITAAMTDGTGFIEFKEKYPDRLFDVGISEEHAVTMAAGLAKNGMKPIVAIYDTFLQRGFDQIMEDVAFQHLPVLFLADRAGVSGHDGETHNGIYGTAFLSAVPGMNVYYPCTAAQTEIMIRDCLIDGKPSVILYPRNEAKLPDTVHLYDYKSWQNILQCGTDAELWCVGTMLSEGLQAAELLNKLGIGITIVSVSSVRPLDEQKIKTAMAGCVPVFTLEEHIETGSFGAILSSYCVQHGLKMPRHLFTLPDGFVEFGKRSDLIKKYELDAQHIADAIRHMIGKE